MKGILIFVGFWVALVLLIWAVNTISKLVQYYKYLNRLKRLEPEVNFIDLSVVEEELTQLNSIAISAFSRIKDKYKVSISEDSASVEKYVSDDASVQRAKRRSVKPGSRIFRKRYWR